MPIALSGSTIVISSGFASGTATGGSATTLTGSGFSTAWANRIVWITGGTGAGQSRFIRAATTTTLTVEPAWDVSPASGSTFSIGYTWADIDAAMASVTVSSASFYLVPNNLTLSAGGFIGSINEHVRFTVSVPVLSTEAGSLWQQGRLLSSGTAAQGGAVELAYAATAGAFNDYALAGQVRWYRVNIAALPSTGNYRINNAITSQGLDFRDCYFNNIYVVARSADRIERCAVNTKPFWIKSAIAPTLGDLSFIENSFVISGDNGAGTDSHYVGLTFEGIPPDAVFSRPYWVWNTASKEGTYFWNTSAPAFADTFAASYWSGGIKEGSGFYTGRTVNVRTRQPDGSALASVLIGLWGNAGNAAWFEGVNTTTGVPINSLTITTDGSGNYANPHPAVAGQSGLVVAERIKKDGATQYGPWTVRARKYGYLEAGGARSYANNATETLIISVDAAITQTDAATVAAYTAIENSAKFYDRYQYFLSLAANIKTDIGLARSGTLIDAGSYNVIIDATAAEAFALSGNTITIKASIYTGDMTTTGIITLANGAQFVGTRTDANGTVAPPVLQSVTVSNGVAGTLLLIQDVTNPEAPITLYLGTPSSWPYAWIDTVDYVADRDIRVRAAYQSGTTAKLFVDEVIGTSTYAAPALGYRLNQQDDTVYNTRAQDGSTVAGITINDVALLIEVTTGAIEWGALYAYEVYWLATSAGIVDEGRITTALDSANYVFEGAWKIKNVSSPVVPLVISGGWGRSAADNTTQSLIDTTGGPIFAAPDQVYTTIVSTASPVITGDISQVPAAVQSGLTAQGLTTARAARLDNLDAAVSSRNAVEPDNLGIAEIKAKTDMLAITGGYVEAVAKAVDDKAGYALTTAERAAVATEVEAALLNDGDGQQLINAIVNAIGNQNVDEIALVAAIRADIERAGGSVAGIKAKTDALPADPAGVSDLPDVSGLATDTQIAAAVRSNLEAGTPVPVDVRLMNSAQVVGDGSEPNPWRGAGVQP
jgi:hypothetical protein